MANAHGYDLNDHLVHIEDSQHNHKWFRFDGLGRKVFMNGPDRGHCQAAMGRPWAPAGLAPEVTPTETAKPRLP